MNKIVDIPDRDPADRQVVAEEARSWLIRLDAGQPAEEELAEFREWIERSPYHRQALKRAAEAWQNLDQLAHVLEISSFRTGGIREQRSTRNPLGFFTSQSAVAGLILVIALGAATATFLNLYRHAGKELFTSEYRTSIGELQSITLPDGSNLRINTNSRIDVAYDQAARVVHLLEGEVWFDVQKNDEKPFMVHAGRYIVRAVGTAFSVHLNSGKIDLTVTEGRVEVASIKDSAMPEAAPDLAVTDEDVSFRVPVVAGQYMRLDDNFEVADDLIELVQRVEPQQIEKKLSWRDGILIFDNDTLEDVVVEINRYTPMKIMIPESGLRDIRLGGYFQAGDVESILATLERSYGIAAEEVKPGLVFLSRR